MKKHIYVFGLMLMFVMDLAGQGQWEWLNPKPDGFRGSGIHFTSPSNGFIFKDQEILVTRDGGNTWNMHRSISSMNCISFQEATAILAGDHGYILKSTDFGENWNQVNTSTTENLNSVTIINNDTIILSSSDKVFKSFNSGTTWVNLGFSQASIVQTAFTSSKTGHAACSDGTIYKTIDGGNSWYETFSSGFIPSNFSTIYFVNGMTGFASREDDKIFKTTDGGESWTGIYDGPAAIFSFYFLNENMGYYAGEYGVIQKTTDGGLHWKNIGFQNGLLSGTDMYSVHFTDTLNGYATGLRGRIIKTTDGGQSWKQYSPMYNRINQVAFPSDSVGFALTDKIFKTSNGGKTWDSLSTGVYNYDGDAYSYLFGQFISADTLFAVADCGLFSFLVRSYDGGATFTKYSVIGQTNNKRSIFFHNGHRGFMCIDNSWGYDGLHKTIDGGETWVRISNMILTKMFFRNELDGFGLKYGKLYHTIDGGVTWSEIYDSDGDLHDLLFVNDSVGYVVGDYHRVLKTTNRGASWIEQNTPYGDLYSVSFFNENVGFASSYDGTLYKTSDGGFTWETPQIPGSSISINITKSKKLFAAGGDGTILRDTLIFDELLLSIDPLIYPGCDSVMLTGAVATNGSDVSRVEFEYGLNNTFDHSVAATPHHIPGGSSARVSLLLKSVIPDTIYNARIKVTYMGAFKYTSEIQFRTRSYCEFFRDQPNIFGDSAWVYVNIFPCLADLSDIVCQYDVTKDYKNTASVYPDFINKNNNLYVKATLKNLNINTGYYYRIKGVLDTMVIYSPDYTFGMTGIGPVNDHDNCILFPNPVKDHLSVKTSKLVKRIDLLNYTGVYLSSFFSADDVNLSTYKPGLYFVKIHFDNTSITRKIIIY